MKKDNINYSQKNHYRIIILILFFFVICINGFIIFLNKNEKNLNTKIIPTSIFFQDSFYYELPFKEYTVILKKLESGNIEGSFWERPIKNIDFNIDPISPHNSLSLDGYLYYVKKQNTFYELQSGGFSTLSLISEADLKSRIINEKQDFKQILCKMSDFPLGITAKAIKCTTTLVNPDDTKQIDQSFINNCYIPLKNGQYLAYEQKLKPIGDIDLCETIAKIGIKEVLIK